MRLTNGHRDIIIERLCEQCFGKQERELHKAKKDFADKVYEDMYPVALRRLMEKLPKGYLPTTDSIYGSFGGQRHWLTMSKVRRVANDRLDKHYTASEPLCAEFFELLHQEKNYQDERNTAIRQARAVLNSCTTLKKLIEVWPEVKPFVADFGKKPVTTKALTLSISELNKHFGFGAQ